MILPAIFFGVGNPAGQIVDPASNFFSGWKSCRPNNQACQQLFFQVGNPAGQIVCPAGSNSNSNKFIPKSVKLNINKTSYQCQGRHSLVNVSSRHLRQSFLPESVQNNNNLLLLLSFVCSNVFFIVLLCNCFLEFLLIQILHQRW